MAVECRDKFVEFYLCLYIVLSNLVHVFWGHVLLSRFYQQFDWDKGVLFIYRCSVSCLKMILWGSILIVITSRQDSTCQIVMGTLYIH